MTGKTGWHYPVLDAYIGQQFLLIENIFGWHGTWHCHVRMWVEVNHCVVVERQMSRSQATVNEFENFVVIFYDENGNFVERSKFGFFGWHCGKMREPGTDKNRMSDQNWISLERWKMHWCDLMIKFLETDERLKKPLTSTMTLKVNQLYLYIAVVLQQTLKSEVTDFSDVKHSTLNYEKVRIEKWLANRMSACRTSSGWQQNLKRSCVRPIITINSASKQRSLVESIMHFTRVIFTAQKSSMKMMNIWIQTESECKR